MGIQQASALSMLLLFLFAAPTVLSRTELRTLMALKAALDADGHVLSSWTEDADPCGGGFEGVACNGDGKVANISLQGKGLSGFIPPAVSELKCLSGLYLHYNALKGVVPKDIANLTELVELYLDVNGLSGNIPEEIGNMGSLQVLQLCCNQLTGSIPNQLGLSKKLTVVALQNNRLTGAIPASLGDLPQLTRLDLSSNQLFGSIPAKLSQIPQLEVLDVRNNRLSGNVPSDLKKLKHFFYANNTDLCGVGFTSVRVCTPMDLLNPNMQEPYGLTNIPQPVNLNLHCNLTHCSKSSKSNSVAIIAAVASVVFGSILCGLFAFAWYRRHKQKISSILEVSDIRLSIDQQKDFDHKSGSSLISLEYSSCWDPLADGRSGSGLTEEVSRSFRFNMEEIEYATQYFSEVNLLGKSGFATTYKGILRDGSSVVVKSINKTSCKSDEPEFLKGLKILTLLRHENLIKLRGFCFSRGRGECFLVYDFINNGSLSLYLDLKEGGKVLEWPARLSIIKGIAKGIEYLHSSKGSKLSLVHQNISADNIFINHHFKPLISGSGLNKLLADDVVFSTLKASAAMGYLAPEYTTVGRFSEKSDVYSFGVIVFQILTGKRRTTHLRHVAESDKIEDLIDEKLNSNFSKEEAKKLVDVALLCTSEIPEQRPTMENVLKRVE